MSIYIIDYRWGRSPIHTHVLAQARSPSGMGRMWREYAQSIEDETGMRPHKTGFCLARSGRIRQGDRILVKTDEGTEVKKVEDVGALRAECA